MTRAMDKWELRMRERIAGIADALGWPKPEGSLEFRSDAAVDWIEDVGLPRVARLESLLAECSSSTQKLDDLLREAGLTT